LNNIPLFIEHTNGEDEKQNTKENLKNFKHNFSPAGIEHIAFIPDIIKLDDKSFEAAVHGIAAKQNEKLLRELSDAIVDPRAMVVHFHDTPFAIRAMVASRGSHDVALAAPFEFYFILLGNSLETLVAD
jgi:hypothetical protein